METDGEGVGGEAERRRRRRSELGRLLEGIESSEDLEKRIPLVKQIEEFSAHDLGLILQCLLASWVDSTCSGVSHCTLHRSILQVALECTDLDITDYMGQLLTLGAKASSWCGKHLQWSVKSIDESEVIQEEEHERLHLEINSLSFSICTKLLGVAAKCFTVLGLEVAAGEAGKGAAAEECVLNMADIEFPTLETMEAEVGHLTVRPRTKGVRRMAPWSLTPVMSAPPQQAPRRRCTLWRLWPNGPGTLCNACGPPMKNSVGAAAAASWKSTLFREGRLLHSSTRRRRRRPGRPSKKKRRLSRKENSTARNDAAALVGVLPCGGDASLDAFFDRTGSEVCWEEAGPEREAAEEEELEWLSNKDAFPSLETMGVEVEEASASASALDVFPSLETMGVEVEEASASASALDTPRARTKGRRRVTAKETCRRAKEMAMPPVRRCTHCATEETPQWRWREGPEGPRTLCNACGLVFKKKGRLLPEYRPAKSSASSPLLHSSTHRHRRAFEMHHQNEPTSAACHGEARSELMEGLMLPPPNGPVSSSPLQRHSPLRHQNQQETSAAGRDTVEARRGEARLRLDSMEVQLRPERPPAFSQMQRYNPLRQERRQSEKASAAGRATTEAGRGEARLESMEVQPLPERPPADSPAFSLVPHRFVLKRRRNSEETSAAGRATTEARLESMGVQPLPERPPADSPAFPLVPHRFVLKRRRNSEEETFAVIRATAKALRAERAAARRAAMED